MVLFESLHCNGKAEKAIIELTASELNISNDMKYNLS